MSYKRRQIEAISRWLSTGSYRHCHHGPVVLGVRHRRGVVHRAAAASRAAAIWEHREANELLICLRASAPRERTYRLVVRVLLEGKGKLDSRSPDYGCGAPATSSICGWRIPCSPFSPVGRGGLREEGLGRLDGEPERGQTSFGLLPHLFYPLASRRRVAHDRYDDEAQDSSKRGSGA